LHDVFIIIITTTQIDALTR